MATTIGSETSIEGLVEDLVHLEHDAIAAYESALGRIESVEGKTHVESFLLDHRQHLSVLSEMARELGMEMPDGGSFKKMLTTGKVAMADLVGDDSTIFKAMKSNEDDTVAAYERASGHGDAIEKSKAFFAKALEDERRHRAWFERASHSN